MPIVAGFPFPLAVEILPMHLPLPAKIRTELLEPIQLDTDPDTRRRQGVRRLDLPRGRGRDPGRHGPAGQAAKLPDLRLRRSFGLSGAVWSADEQRAVRVARRLRTGQVDVNGGAFNPPT